MRSQLEAYLETLESLLDAGDTGQTLQRKHLPHARSDFLFTPGRPELSARGKVEVALPPVLLSGYCHVAEVDLDSQRIFYKRILNQQEADICTSALFLHEAQDFQAHWSEELQADPRDCTVVQTRSADNKLSWEVFGTLAHKIGPITRRSQFMELARVARVIYTD
ncbi:hypothetical protein HBI23_253760 [Parastagonospora nodorum]|nr:hypothetical protein HBI23_253760 [Parastagonospora nodorum]KAH6383051.1 hypothetical protein HBI60_259140 [Parastagonospora nodorum]